MLSFTVMLIPYLIFGYIWFINLSICLSACLAACLSISIYIFYISYLIYVSMYLCIYRIIIYIYIHSHVHDLLGQDSKVSISGNLFACVCWKSPLGSMASSGGPRHLGGWVSHQSPSIPINLRQAGGIDGDWTGPNITIQIIPWVPIFSISGATQQHHNVVLPPAVHFAAPPRLLRPSHLQRMPPRPPGSICLVGIQRAALEPWEQCTQIGHIGCLRDEYPMAVSNNMAQIWKLMINRY